MDLPIDCLENRLSEFFSRTVIEGVAMGIKYQVDERFGNKRKGKWRAFKRALREEYESMYDGALRIANINGDPNNLWYVNPTSQRPGGILYFSDGKPALFVCELRTV